ncbi:MAG: hemolysin III family protein [Roseburia sp.]
MMQITIREPGSAITHFIGMMMAVLAAMPLLAKAGMSGDIRKVEGMMIFMGSMILLYGASTLYHSVTVDAKKLRIFQKMDHMMIFVLIAGTYTPVCMNVIGGNYGMTFLALVWGVAAAGILLKAFWITCPKWFSSVLYIGMGWICVFVFGRLLPLLTPQAFFWLFIGGVIYTAGGIIYALKLPLFNTKHRNFGSHEVFHLFVMAGSICHYIFMYFYVV